jgi:hypothetical protein
MVSYVAEVTYGFAETKNDAFIPPTAYFTAEDKMIFS